MKRRPLHTIITPLAAISVATCLFACEKKPEQTSKPSDSTAPAAATPAAQTTAAKVVEAVKEAVAPADYAALKQVYGFAALLPKDVEAFGSSYRLSELWEKLAASKWADTLLNLAPLKADPKFQDMLTQWRTNPQAQMGKKIVNAFFGGEFTVAYPSGFADKIAPWVDLASEVQAVNFQRQIMTAMGGGKRPDPKDLLRDAAPDLIPALAKCDLPPFFAAFKAGAVRADVDGALGMMTQQLGTQLPPGVELGSFKIADKHEFRSISATGSKLIAALGEDRLASQLKIALGEDALVQEVLGALKAKTIEIAWGWVDDYFVLSFGPTHGHLKFAASDSDSALAIAAVTGRATEYLPKKPLGLSYMSAAFFDKIGGKIEFAEDFKEVSGELEGLLKPEHIAAMQADVKKLEARAQEIFTTKYGPAVNVSYWDGGIRAEAFGGAKLTAFDFSKPLGLGSLVTSSVVLFGDGRSNSANAGKTADFIEEASATLFGWYDKYGRTMVPEDERQGAAMVEALAIPMVKEMWGSFRKLSAALGDESALVLDLSGKVPAIPDLPPFLGEGKVPRMAWVSELKDRAGVSEAWKGFEKVIKQLSSFAPGGVAVPEPQMKQEGDVELHFIQPPVPTDDLLPHIAITKDRWIFSTSPSFTKEIATKSAATGGKPLGSEWRVQVPALCDLAEVWLSVVDKNKDAMIRGSGDRHDFEKMRPVLGDAIRLLRSISAIEFRMFEEGGEPRGSAFIKLEDLK